MLSYLKMPRQTFHFTDEEWALLEAETQKRGAQSNMNQIVREAVVASLKGNPELVRIKTRALQTVNLAMVGILWVTGLMIAGWGSL